MKLVPLQLFCRISPSAPVALAACQRFIRDTDPNTRKAGEPMIAATRATRQRMGENILIPAPNRRERRRLQCCCSRRQVVSSYRRCRVERCLGRPAKSLPAMIATVCRQSRSPSSLRAAARVRPSWRSDQDSYLNESATRVRNAVTFPFSTLMSIFVTSATRKSRSEPAAVSTAFRPASSHDFSLTPTTSTIR